MSARWCGGAGVKCKCKKAECRNQKHRCLNKTSVCGWKNRSINAPNQPNESHRYSVNPSLCCGIIIIKLTPHSALSLPFRSHAFLRFPSPYFAPSPCLPFLPSSPFPPKRRGRGVAGSRFKRSGPQRTRSFAGRGFVSTGAEGGAVRW